MDKSQLGSRYTCFECGTKFYDLNRPEPLCPECGKDQREAPVRDLKSLLVSKGTRRRKARDEEEEEAELPSLGDDDDDDDDDDDMFDSADDDDDDDDGDADEDED